MPDQGLDNRRYCAFALRLAIDRKGAEVPTLATLIECWQMSEDHRFNAPASRQSITSAEQELSRALPVAMQELFAFSDGLSPFGGTLNIYPLREANNQLPVVAVTPWLRECNWPIPDDLLIFGDTGSDELLGFWVGERNIDHFPSPVIQVGAIFEERCMAMMATNFLHFLAIETAISALTNNDADLLERLQFPNNLIESEDVADTAVRQWADPSFPATSVDPYESRLDARALRKLLA